MNIAGQQIYQQQKKIYSASDKAVYLMQNGRTLANRFQESAMLNLDARAVAKSDLLAETYRARNIFHATDLHNGTTGELFDGYGVLVQLVSSRMSPAYLSGQGRRARKRIRERINDTKLLVGERYRFLTLTMPYLETDVATVLKIKDRAATLFKKRKLWTVNVRAAFIAEEMTVGESSTILYTHYNAHSHALLVGKYIQQWEIADVWTDCVEKACSEYGVEFLMRNIVSNRLTVDIKDVETYGKKKGRTLDESVDELCKYVVKGSDFDKVPVEKLVEIEDALFNRQMIKSYGDFNRQKGKEKSETVAERTSLDTKYITDGDARLKPKQPRKPPLVEVGVKMILDGRRDDWLEMLGVVAEHRREFRIDYLAHKMPFATFRTLDGSRWFGVSERAPKSNIVSLSEHRVKSATRANADVPPYPLLPKAAPITQVKRMSNWELFESFCDLSGESETDAESALVGTSWN